MSARELLREIACTATLAGAALYAFAFALLAVQP